MLHEASNAFLATRPASRPPATLTGMNISFGINREIPRSRGGKRPG
jgi:hypothetical protein